MNEQGISVIIPALDEQAQIRTILDQTRFEGVERIVVDGGSSDETAAAARSAGAEAILVSAPGRARQLTAGVEKATQPIILLLHADTRLPPDWPDPVRAAVARPDVVGGAFALRFSSGPRGMDFVGWGATLRARLFGVAYGDQALFMRRDALAAIGGIPDVSLFEDLDLVRALARHGRFVHLREAVETSGRRYERNGILKTVAVHQLALGGYLLGVDRDRLADLYRRLASR